MIHMNNLGVNMKICHKFLITEASDYTIKIFMGYDFSIF